VIVSSSPPRKIIYCDCDCFYASVEMRDDPTLRLKARIRRVKALESTHKLYVKIRFANFRQTTVECVGSAVDPALYRTLLETGYQRARLPVRLLGASIRTGEDAAALQLGLFGE